MTTADELWELLPAVYRQRDAEANQGGALRALVDVLGQQSEIVAQDLARLYDNWFVETCDPWVVPYIGDLVGARPLRSTGGGPTPRAYVANTVAYRRRKGTPAVLEQLTRDVTGWPTRVVEFFQLLGTTQHLDHRRLGNLRTPDLRRGARLERLGGPFESASHLMEARHVPQGRYGTANVGLFVWRLEPVQLFRVSARPVTDPPDGRFHVDPTGRDVPLFNPPVPETTITSLARERHVPGPLPRRALFDELEARRAGRPVGDLPFFGADPVFEVFADLGDGWRALAPEQVTVADLSDPPTGLGVTTGWRRPAEPVLAAVDPVLGRVAFRDDLVPSRVEVSHCTASPGRVGAGAHERADDAVMELVGKATFVRAVGAELPARAGLVVASLADALAEWTAEPSGAVGVIALLDNRTQAGPVTVEVPAGSTLVIAGGAWPQVESGEPPGPASLGQFRLDEHRPHLSGDVTVTGLAGGAPDLARGELTLSGLLIEGAVRISDGDLGRLRLASVTLVPTNGGLEVTAGNRDLTLAIERTVTGPVRVAGEGPELVITTSIVDGSGATALDVAQLVVRLDAATVVGDARCRTLHASDCLVTGRLEVTRVQQGCLRFSYVRDPLRTPPRYRCQPDLALAAAGGAAAVRARLVPQLLSTRFGDPAYAHLADRNAEELLTGSSARSHVGAYGHLLVPQRLANLATVLDEYLRFGLQAGPIPVT